MSLTSAWKTSSTLLRCAAEVSRKRQPNLRARSAPSSGEMVRWPLDSRSTWGGQTERGGNYNKRFQIFDFFLAAQMKKTKILNAFGQVSTNIQFKTWQHVLTGWVGGVGGWIHRVVSLSPCFPLGWWARCRLPGPGVIRRRQDKHVRKKTYCHSLHFVCPTLSMRFLYSSASRKECRSVME